MMINDQALQRSDKVRVSIVERLVPSFSLGFVALSGSAGMLWWLGVIRAFKTSENVGLDAVYAAILETKVVVIVFLAVAAFVGLAGIAASAIRLFTENRKASPPGILFSLLGLFSTVSPMLFVALLWLVLNALQSPGVGLGSLETTMWMLCLSAFIASAIAFVALLAFSFIPFSSRPGRKYSPLVFLIINEIGIVVLALDIIFFGNWPLP